MQKCNIVEVGKIAFVNHGKEYGRWVIIVEIVDQYRILVEDENSRRKIYPIKRLSLDQQRVKIEKGLRVGTLKTAIKNSKTWN